MSRSENKIFSMYILIAYYVTSQIPVYWPPYPMHYGICANCLLAHFLLSGAFNMQNQLRGMNISLGYRVFVFTDFVLKRFHCTLHVEIAVDV